MNRLEGLEHAANRSFDKTDKRSSKFFLVYH